MPSQGRSGEPAELPGELGGKDLLQQLVGDGLGPGTVKVVAFDRVASGPERTAHHACDVIPAEVDEHRLRPGGGP